MKNMFKALLVLSALFFFSPQAAMAEGYAEKAGEKLTDGVANAVTGVLEFPKTVIVDSQSQGPAYGMTFGLVKGMWNTIFRTGVGIFDAVTFMIPTKTLVTPKVVWQDFNKPTTFNLF
ncbi:exosortase system-associated protein, TIGR04073 family [Nitrosovibrio tenuis]|uniref:Putative exosortase-associated protein, TIGR04073 family n=1 Tax=Nitrosovibrio tenuis TaxID=1233 RepID=A0A1H7R202_9PROT|nr:exosortase system-associated protein, TIGR04073 family [Nitrosovibrio tenuis]SEL54246.1 putative exosortase-associated protein, TIGR04073 family [Nitrosovibrio tenuis]